MKGTSKRLLSLFMVFCMLFSMMPVSVFATDTVVDENSVIETVQDEQNAALVSSVDETSEDNTITGTIDEDMVWNDGDIVGPVTIKGGTAKDPIEITVNGTVTVAGTIRLSPDTISNVVFNAGTTGATLIRSADFTGQMFYSEGVSGNFQTMSFNGITLDGGAVWTGDVDKTLNRGTVNEGVKATGSVLYLVYANATLTNSTLQNHDDSTGEKANAVFLRYYSTVEFNNSVVKNNNSIATYYRGGVVTVRQGGTVITNNADVYGNSGAAGGFMGISSTGSYGGVAKVYNSKFHNNYSDNGAVFLMQCNSNRGYLLVDGCEFYDNASETAVLTEWAYSRPFIIKNSYFHDNECAVWDCHTDPVLDISGKFVVEEDADYTKYLFETPLALGGELAEGSSIAMSEASITQLMTKSGYVVTGTEDYQLTEADLSKFVLPEGYKFDIMDANGDGINDAVAVKKADTTYVDVTVHDNFPGSTASETQSLPTSVKGLPALNFAHEGYEFVGWMTSADGTEVIAPQMFTEPATLYAKWANYVAEVGGTKYESLAEAVAAANAVENGGTVTLLQNVTLAEKLTISGNVTIQGKYTITRDDTYTGTLFAVNAGASLTVKDITVDGGNNWSFDETGYMAALEDSSKHQDFAFVTSAEGAPVATADMFTIDGTVVLDGATIKNHMGNSSCNVFGLNTNAALTLNGATITHCATPFESTVVAMSAGSVFAINDDTVISGNYAGRNGGVSRNNNGTIVMNGGEIKNNYSVNTNGTVFMLYGADSMFEMNDGAICGNTGVNGPNNGRNAAIYMHTGSKLVMNGGTICHNTGTSYGGIDAPYTGVEGDASAATLKGGSVIENVSILGNTNKDINGGAALTISGGTYTQDVSKWVANDLGIVYDNENGVYVVTKDVAKVNDTVYTSIAKAVAAAANGDTITVLAGSSLDETVIIDKNVTLDLNGYAVYANNAAVDPAFRIQADVTVKNGTVDARNGVAYAFILGKTDGTEGNLTIESGKYYGETTVASVTKGTLTVEGGEYWVSPYVEVIGTEIVDGKEVDVTRDNYNFLLNCIDANYKDGSAVIEVKGGTFHNFDPANNAAEGAGTHFVPEGYESVETETGSNVWSVVEKPQNLDMTTAFRSANDDSGEGWTWDVETKTLTLNGLEYTTEVGEVIIVPDGAVITLVGENKIATTATGAKGIYAKGAVTINGTGSLDISLGGGNAIYAENAGGDAIITIDGVTLTANGGITTADTCVNASLILKDANVNVERNSVSIRNDNGTRGENGKAGTATISMDNSYLYTGPVFVGAHLSSNHSYTRTSAVFQMNDSSIDIQGGGKQAMIFVWGDCGVDFDVVDSNVKIWNSGWQTNDIDIQGGNDHYGVTGEAGVTLDVNIERSNLDMYGYWSGLSVGRYYSNGADIKFNVDESTISTMTKYGSSGISVAESTENGTTEKKITNSITYLTNDPGNSGTQMEVNATIYGNPVLHQDYTVVMQTGGTHDFSTVDFDFVLGENQTITITKGKTFTSAKAITMMPGSTIKGNYNGEVIPADGYEVVITGEGNDKVITVESKIDAVAAIGETEYETLAKAVADANEAGIATITLLKDVTLAEKLTISGNVTIEGAYTITRDDAYTGTLFAVNAGASLTLDGGLTIDGGNEWTMDMDAYKDDLAAFTKVSEGTKYFTPEEGAPVATAHMITTSGNLNLNKVTIKNHYANGETVLVSASTGANVTLTGATITHNAITSGSGLVVNASSGKWDTTPVIWVTMNEGTVIDGNHVGGNHGVFKVYMGTEFTMNGGVIKNTTGWNSNGVAVGVYWATFNMKGGEICSNSSVYGPNNGRNAPVYLHSASIFEMTGGSICHNVGGSRSGLDAPYADSTSNGTASISGGYIGENSSYYHNNGVEGYNADITGGDTLIISGGTYTQDVSEWLAPNCGLVYDEATGTYTVTNHVYNLYFRDPATGEQVPGVGPLKGNNAASLVKTGKLFYADYYEMELEVLSNVKIDETIVIDYPMTVNLNGKTITGADDVYPVIRVMGGADVTVKDGNIVNSDYVFVLGASDGSSAGNLTIESGSYKGDTSVASVTKGTLTVLGGEFEVEPYEGNYNFLLNCIDANYKDGSAVIEVKGGTFHNFDPANNAAEGAGTDFVANGYKSVDNGDGTWTVQEAEVAENTTTGVKYTSLQDALNAAVGGQTIKLLTDITYTEADVVTAIGGASGYGKYVNPAIIYFGGTKINEASTVNAVLDLNGHTITNDADAYLFLPMDNSKLTIKDSSEAQTGKVDINTKNPAIWTAGMKTMVTIESGSFNSAGTELLWVTHGGDMVITGGKFSLDVENASKMIVINARLATNAPYFVDGSTSLSISGGTFYGFNPEKTIEEISNTELVETNCVANGYKAVDNGDGTYVVEPNMIFEMHLTDANGEAHWLSPMNSNSFAGIIKTCGIWYESLQGTYDFTLKVLGDYEIDETVVIDYPMTIDLGGYTLTTAEGVVPAIRIVDGADVTVKNGTIDASSYAFILGASDGSSAGNLTIESGSYKGGTTVASVTKGTLTVLGGEFEVEPYEGNYNFLLNCIDANYKDGSAVIEVKGGTFHNFDPANNAAEGAGTNFVADGYESVDNGNDTWTVNQIMVAEVNGTEYPSIQEAMNAIPRNGSEPTTIKILKDHTVSAKDSDYALITSYWQNITLDLNGKTVTFDYTTKNNANTVYASIYFYGGNMTVTGNGKLYNKGLDEVTSNESRIIWIATDAVVTIENGTFESDQKDTMFYTSCTTSRVTRETQLFIKGGTFLQNVGDDCFNMQDNSASWQYIELTGGTYNVAPKAGFQNSWEVTIPEGYEVVDNGDGTWTVVEAKEEVVYTFLQSTQLGLIEPWFLKSNLYLKNEAGQFLTETELNGLKDFGVYFIRASELSNPTEMPTVETILNNVDTIKYSKNDETRKAVVEKGTAGYMITASYEEGIYTYELSDTVYVLYYIEDASGVHYDVVKERNLHDIADAAKDNTSFDESERAVYKRMIEMEAAITTHRATFDSIPEMSSQNAPLVTEGQFGEFQTGYTFNHSMNVVLIEPWGIQLNGYVDASVEFEDAGVVVFYDKNGVYETAPSIEDLVNNEGAYVFSTANGDATATSSGNYSKITAIYTKDVYTYQLDDNAYAVFFVKIDGVYHFGEVKTRNILTTIQGLVDNTNFSETERTVYQSMIDMHADVTAHRAKFGL